jgi:hypothetical protein
MNTKTVVGVVMMLAIAGAATPAIAQDSGGLPALADRVKALEGEVVALQAQLIAVNTGMVALQSRLDALHSRKASVSIPPYTFEFVDASCAAGEQVLGGGHASFVPLSAAIAPQVWDSAPAVADDGTTQVWRLGVYNQNSAPMAFTVYAVCLAP